MSRKLVYDDFVVLADKLRLDFVEPNDENFIPDTYIPYTYRSRLTHETQRVMRTHLTSSINRGVYSMRAENRYYYGRNIEVEADEFFVKANIHPTLRESYVEAYHASTRPNILIIPELVAYYNVMAAQFNIHWMFEPSYENVSTYRDDKYIEDFLADSYAKFSDNGGTLASLEEMLREDKFFAKQGLFEYTDQIQRLARYFPSCSRNISVWMNPSSDGKVFITSFNKLFYAPIKWLCDSVGLDYTRIKSESQKLIHKSVVSFFNNAVVYEVKAAYV